MVEEDGLEPVNAGKRIAVNFGDFVPTEPQVAQIFQAGELGSVEL